MTQSTDRIVVDKLLIIFIEEFLELSVFDKRRRHEGQQHWICTGLAVTAVHTTHVSIM